MGKVLPPHHRRRSYRLFTTRKAASGDPKPGRPGDGDLVGRVVPQGRRAGDCKDMRASPKPEASGSRFAAGGRLLLIGVDTGVDFLDPGRKCSEQFRAEHLFDPHRL